MYSKDSLDSEDSLNSDEEEELENERIGNDEWCVWGKNAKQWRHIPRVFAAKKPTKLKKHIFKEEAVYVIIYLIALHKYIRKFEGQPILFFRDTPK